MSDTGNVSKSLRERLGGTTEDRLGRALSELFENPLLTGAIGRAFDAREKAAQAQEVAMGALNLPSAADIERLTRRLRAVSHRLEGIEDGVDRLDRALAPSGVEARLSGIETQLEQLTEKLDRALKGDGAASGRAPAKRGASGGGSGSRAGEAVAHSDKQVRAAREAKSRKAPKGKTARSAKTAKALRSASGSGAGSRASRKS